LLYLILDEFLSAEEIAKLRASYGDPSLADLNSVFLDGQRVSLGELQAAADALPFLADRRLVVVRRLLARFSTRGEQKERAGKGSPSVEERFAEYLNQIPPTTDLVLVEESEIDSRSVLYRALRSAGATIIAPPDLKSGELVKWVQRRARHKGSRLAPGVAEKLVDEIGVDLRALDQELEKLSLYCGQAEVQEADVARLVTASRTTSIFAMVDALGIRNHRQVVSILHDLLQEGEQPLKILALIARQWRLLVEAKELREMGGGPAEVASRLRVAPWQARKLLGQERSFSREELKALYRALLDTDVAIKTGQVEPVLGLDLFVAAACRRSA